MLEGIFITRRHNLPNPATAGALAEDPRILLLDELTTFLDIEDQVRRTPRLLPCPSINSCLFRRWCGITTHVASHRWSMRFCTHWMEFGQPALLAPFMLPALSLHSRHTYRLRVDEGERHTPSFCRRAPRRQWLARSDTLASAATPLVRIPKQRRL